MSIETGLQSAVTQHISANHQVTVNASAESANAKGTIRDGADPAANVHSITVRTKNETLVNALMSAIVANGLS